MEAPQGRQGNSRRCLRLAAALILCGSAAWAQRVVDPEAPWKVEGAGKPVSRATGVIPQAGPPIQAGEFVRRQGSVLTLAGVPFRFNGNNVYYNQADLVYGRQAGVEETLDKMAGLGMTVVRSNAHNDNPQSSDPAAIQLQPGVYAEASLAALDRSIALAKARNLRLILKLTNNWDAYGGIRRYVAWQLGRTPVQAEWGLFYTSDLIKAWYKNYVKMLIERRNTVTGVLYREEPAILAWELGNELRNPSTGGADALLQWTAEMAAYIKSLDANHLVADGGEGFDDDRSLYTGLSNSYPVAGSDGCSYHRLVTIPDVDMVSYHLYPAGWSINDGNDAAIYIRRHEELARDAGKVAYFGEYGRRANNASPAGCSRAPGRAFDPQRAAIYQQWFGYSAIEQASSGVMVWQLINDGKDDCEGFQVYCPLDAATCDFLKSASDGMSAAPVAVNAATFLPVRLAPGSIATLFGSGLDNALVVVADAKGRTYDARVFFSGPGQINFKVPEPVPAGGAIIRVVRDGVTRSSAGVVIEEVAPGLFTAAASGKGLAAGIATLIAQGGERRTQFLARYEGDKLVGIPVALPAGGAAVISFFGTGLRGAAGATAKVKGVAAEVLYSGTQGEFDGLDQVNVLVPTGLAGSGEVDVELTFAGKAANVVRVVLE